MEMDFMRILLSRCQALFGRRRLNEDLEAELNSHIELAVEENMKRGMPEQEARAAARRAIGGLTQTKERYRVQRGVPAIETLVSDVRYAFRQIRKSPGFAFTAIVTLALGIGANTAIFSFVDALFLRPLPVPNPEQLLRIYAKGPSGYYGAGFSYPEFKFLRDHNSSFAALSVEIERPQFHMVTGEDSREIRGEYVSGNYFSLFGIQPRLGRAFLPEEDAIPNRNGVAVISDRLWKTQFNGDPATLGREIHINGAPIKIVGIAPPGFDGDLPGAPIAIWIPAMMIGAAGYGCVDGTFNCALFDGMVGRLAPGRTAADAQAEASSTIVWSASDWPQRPSRRQIVVTSANGESLFLRAEDAAEMHLLLSVTASLLLIACANLAGLILARGVTRRREIAVRLSMGASRTRVTRQLLTESLLLAAFGGIAGLGTSFLAKDLLSKFYATDSEGFHHLYDLSLDWRVLVYSTALTLITGTLFGLVPAIRASRQDLVTELKEGGPAEQSARGWLRHILVVGQVALSMVLVIAAGLLIRSSFEIGQGTNFDPEHMIVLRLRPQLIKYTQEQMDALVRRVREQLSGAPAVESLTFIEGGEGLVWDWQSGRDIRVSLSGQAQDQGAALRVPKQDVAENFFQTLRVPLLQGREFDARDRIGSPPVAIANEALAKRLGILDSALGRTVLIDGKKFQIVGVSADIQPQSSIHVAEPHLYLSYWQSNATQDGDIRLAIRVAGDSALALPAIRRLIESLDSNVPISEDMAMSEQVNLEYGPTLLARSVLSFCGLLALCLSAMGLYSILAFAVRTRTREIGIRMALGARREDVLRLVVGQGATLAFIGVTAGAIAALISMRMLASLLFGVKTTDPATYICVTVLLVVVALVACYVPARRAASIDPMRALRTE
jgi:macrolide transport system ATP-binding/permease protein